MFEKVVVIIKKFDLQPTWGKLGGKSFIIVSFFAVTGFILAMKGKLTDSYAALATALSGFHVWRAVKQDTNGNGDGQ